MVRARVEGGRRAFTLFEVLIVVMLLLALSAISIPVMISYAEAAAFERTCDRLRAAGMYARAEAERSGQGVELVLARINGVWSLVARNPPAASDSFGTQAAEDDRGELGGDLGASDRLGVMSGEVLMECPARWRVERPGARSEGDGGRDAVDASELEAGSELVDGRVLDRDGAADAGRDEDEGPIVLGMYWPGGLVVASPGTVRVDDGRGRRALVRINTWTGGLEVTPLAAVSDQSEGAGEEGDESAESGAEERESEGGNGPLRESDSSGTSSSPGPASGDAGQKPGPEPQPQPARGRP